MSQHSFTFTMTQYIVVLKIFGMKNLATNNCVHIAWYMYISTSVGSGIPHSTCTCQDKANTGKIFTQHLY